MATRRERLEGYKIELAAIDEAIMAILKGAQRYRLGSRDLTRADLATLYRRKDKLEDLVESLSYPGGRFKRIIPRH